MKDSSNPSVYLNTKSNISCQNNKFHEFWSGDIFCLFGPIQFWISEQTSSFAVENLFYNVSRQVSSTFVHTSNNYSQFLQKTFSNIFVRLT